MAENSNLVDLKLYKKASQRSHFKFHLAIYALAMLVLWIVYIFVFKNSSGDAGPVFFKCTLFVTLLWTVILVFHYLFIYKLNSSALEKEIKTLEKEIKALEEKKQELLAKRNSLNNQNQ